MSYADEYHKMEQRMGESLEQGFRRMQSGEKDREIDRLSKELSEARETIRLQTAASLGDKVISGRIEYHAHRANQRARNAEEDKARLIVLASEIFEKAKSEYRKRHSGGCRLLSKGDKCECFLCAMDNFRVNAVGRATTLRSTAAHHAAQQGGPPHVPGERRAGPSPGGAG